MADLSEQFDVVRVPHKPDRGQAFTRYNYVAMQDGKWAGGITYNPPETKPDWWSDETEQIQITGRGPAEVRRNWHSTEPTINDVAVASEHRGKGLADHLANHALSQAYTDDPGMRGNADVVGTYLSPMSVPWRRRLTGESGTESTEYPSWGEAKGEYDDWSDAEPDHDAMESFVEGRKGTDMRDIYDEGLGEPAPEPKGTVEDRKREFRKF